MNAETLLARFRIDGVDCAPKIDAAARRSVSLGCGVAATIALSPATAANIGQTLAIALGLKSVFLVTTIAGAALPTHPRLDPNANPAPPDYATPSVTIAIFAAK